MLRQKILLTGILLVFCLGVVASFRAQRSTTTAPDAVRVTVASKDFTESILLAEIISQLLEARGVAVQRRFELGGNLPHEALLSGEADLYPEYTGTAFTAILHHEPITDPRAVYDQTQKEYQDKLNLELSRPLGFENTFAILVRGNDARKLRLTTISDSVPHAPQWRAGLGQDFMSRADGYPGFSKAYGLKFAEVREMDLSLTYIALASNKVDLIAGNSTEGRIAKLDLLQLQDDRHYFPPYEAVYIVRRDALSRSQILREVINLLGNRITTEEMRQLNYEVDGDKKDIKEVVRQWIIRRKL